MAKLSRVFGEPLTQGFIVDNVGWGVEDEPLGIVLSNPCDFEHDKAGFILIASLIPAKETLQESKEFKQQVEGASEAKGLSNKKWAALTKYLNSFIHNAEIRRYFFLDPDDVLEAPLFFVDFQHLITLPIQKRDNLRIEGKLASPYREKLITHFASYISRIGVDRIDDASLEYLQVNLANPFHTSN